MNFQTAQDAPYFLGRPKYLVLLDEPARVMFFGREQPADPYLSPRVLDNRPQIKLGNAIDAHKQNRFGHVGSIM